MSLNSSILLGLVGGAAAFGGLMWSWMHTDDYQVASLENLVVEVDQLRGRANEDFESEERIYRELVTRWTKLRGPTNSHALWFRMELAQCYALDKKYDQAEVEYRMLIDLQDQSEGHLSSVGLRNNLADVLRLMGKRAEEETQLRIVVALEGRWRDKPNIRSDSPRERLLATLDYQEKYREEREILMSSLAVIAFYADEQRTRWGERGGAWKSTDYRLGESLYWRRVDWVSQKESLKARWQVLKEKLGENDPATQSSKAEFQKLKNTASSL